MHGYTPGLFDRLLSDSGHSAAGRDAAGLSLEQLKDAVARDLEDLLNTRAALPEAQLAEYPACRASIVNYGLLDFAGLCLGSSDDRARICASLKAAIERHEPRLKNIQARLERAPDSINRVNFVINARLRLAPDADAINFDAVLQPSSLHYTINHSARGATA
ncbi:type VI secretion system baseplate subunit TssE [Oxalobacteraceae bacterium]|nr:type VI secretion system baseplate subunit TssE [Oxalobacteraceae bacterium]